VRAPGCPFAAADGYLSRPAERLVVNGLRLWAAGYDEGEIACWEEAWNLYAATFGAERARPAVTQLSHWVKAICLWRPERLRCFAANCPFVCRDECLAAALIAASQHGDGVSLGYCAERLGGPAGRADVMESGIGFAQTLDALGQRLVPVPQDVLRSLVEEPPRASYH
jgi:hypothetical protein